VSTGLHGDLVGFERPSLAHGRRRRSPACRVIQDAHAYLAGVRTDLPGLRPRIHPAASDDEILLGKLTHVPMRRSRPRSSAADVVECQSPRTCLHCRTQEGGRRRVERSTYFSRIAANLRYRLGHRKSGADCKRDSCNTSWEKRLSRRKEVASTILDVFEQQRSKPGYSLPAAVIAALAEHKGWTTAQLLAGIEYGCLSGWFRISPRACLYLTCTGVEAFNKASFGD
jgi:hypothetical protein